MEGSRIPPLPSHILLRNRSLLRENVSKFRAGSLPETEEGRKG